jgi:outer membrane protein assembly factor BamB/DNA-directed RNA polymerase subunit RPC12/RpoP
MALTHTSGKCPNCSATVDLRPDADGLITCEYCDHQHRLNRKGAAATPEAQARAKRMVLLLAGVALVIAGALPVFMIVGSSGSESIDQNAPSASVPNLSLPDLKAAIKGTKQGWDTVGGPPQIVTLDGEEHLVGRLRERGSDNLSIGIIRSKDLKERWKTPPLGTYGDAYRAIRHAAVGKVLLASDGRNTLHAYDLGTGKVLKSHPMTDQVKQLCVVEGQKGVWVQSADKRNVLFGLALLTVKDAPKRPASCPRSAFISRLDRPGKVSAAKHPKVSDFKAKRLFSDGGQAVVFGAKSPGTAIPIAVGFDPATKKVRWNKSILQVNQSSYRTSFYKWQAGLAGGRFITFYGVGSDDEWRAVAFDAASGDLLWETKLKPIFAVDKVDGITVTPKHVYLVRTSSLDVLEAKTGRLIGSVGDETYD